ncbi:MAG: YCF48-related protein [Ignavibacteriaceae bacterium]
MDKAKYPPEKNLHYIDFVTPGYGWVGGPYSLFHTTNGGVEWKTLINKTALDTLIEGFVFIDKSYGWMNIYEDNNNISKIYKTTDGGNNWDLQYTSPPLSYVEDIRFTDMNNGFLLLRNYYNYLIKTTDGGATWHSHLIDTLDTSTLNKIFFLNSQTGWAAGEKLFTTTDGGINWTFLEDKYVGRDMRDIQFINPDTGWYSDLNGVYKTTDGGQNWNNQLFEYGEYDASAIFFTDKDNGWFCRYITLYHTSDGGLTWKTQLNFDSLGIKDVYFTD